MQRQRGTILLIVMMVLLVLNLYAVGMMEMVDLEERMTAEFMRWMGAEKLFSLDRR